MYSNFGFLNFHILELLFRTSCIPLIGSTNFKGIAAGNWFSSGCNFYWLLECSGGEKRWVCTIKTTHFNSHIRKPQRVTCGCQTGEFQVRTKANMLRPTFNRLDQKPNFNFDSLCCSLLAIHQSSKMLLKVESSWKQWEWGDVEESGRAVNFFTLFCPSFSSLRSRCGLSFPGVICRRMQREKVWL